MGFLKDWLASVCYPIFTTVSKVIVHCVYQIFLGDNYDYRKFVD